MQHLRLLSLIFLSHCAQALNRQEGGFDFGTGCPSGVGEPFSVELVKNDIITVGIIPKGKFDVYVILKAGKLDIDIRLYDTENLVEFPQQGQAIVAWCPEMDCNMGVLGGLHIEDKKNYTTAYGDMEVTYSGYNGVDNLVGNEFIQITGETLVDIRMEAYAFTDGSGTVEYQWGPSQTGCCLGVEACGGEFQREMVKNEIVDVGEIPVNKLDLVVTLEADVDLDIQLWDQSDNGRWSEGKAIISWCAGGKSGCNFGILNGPKKDRTVYPSKTQADGLEYRYSGYNGVDNKLGHEYIEILGGTNRPLMMAAFAYKAGFATVKYTYYEPKDDVVVKPKLCAGQATYYIRFSATWNSREHAHHFPYYPRFGKVVATTHHHGFTMFRDDGYYAGEAMTSLVRDDDEYPLREKIAKETFLSVGDSVILDEVEAGGSSRSTITFTGEHPWLSAAAKVRPSPDWFVGLRDFNFCVDGKWLDDLAIPMDLFDVGRVGGNEFTSRSTTKGEVEVSRITPNEESPSSFPKSYYGDKIPAMGSLAFARA